MFFQWNKNPGYFFRSKITFLIVLNFFSGNRNIEFFPHFIFEITKILFCLRRTWNDLVVLELFLKNITFRLWGIVPPNYNFFHILGHCVKALALHWRVLINNHLWRAAAAFLQVFQGHLRDVKLDFPKM